MKPFNTNTDVATKIYKETRKTEININNNKNIFFSLISLFIQNDSRTQRTITIQYRKYTL